MMKITRTTILITMIFICGCMTSDPQHIMVLSNRINELEEQLSSANDLTYMIVMDNSSIFPVTIVKVESQHGKFKGPLGEFYEDKPTQEQIEKLYRR